MPSAGERLVQVCLFARARDLAGADQVMVRLSEGDTVGDLRHKLAREYPALSSLLERSALAVNGEFSDNTLPLPVGAELALLPPVSGG